MNLILPFIGAFLGWRGGRRDAMAARKLARQLSVASIVIFLLTAVTGWIVIYSNDYSIHLWIGNRFLSLAMFAIPFAIFLTIQQYLRQRPFATISQVTVFLFLLLVIFLAGLTGFLGPRQAAQTGKVISNATNNRFIVLHLVFIPTLILPLLVEWWWFFGEKRKRGPNPSSASDNSQEDQ